MRIFITGGSGFVGGHLIETFSKGHEVVAMARSERSAGVVAGFGARPARCSLGEVGREHLEGCELVIHSAGFVEEWGTRDQFERANIEGTRQLLEVSRAAGASRFIFIGTEAALFSGEALENVDETVPYPPKHRFLYSETKAAAEALVLAANGEGMSTVSIRPRIVWGPRDGTILPSVLKMLGEGRFMWLDQGEVMTSTTHVENLCHAVSLAVEKGGGGEAYFVADAEISTVRDFLTALVATQGVEIKARSIPGAVARPVSSVVEAIWRVCRLKGIPPLHLFPVAMMSRNMTVCTDKARDGLGYAPVIGLEEGMARLRALK